MVSAIIEVNCQALHIDVEKGGLVKAARDTLRHINTDDTQRQFKTLAHNGISENISAVSMNS